MSDGTYRAATARLMEALTLLGSYRGPCGLCGHPDARHRQADALKGGLLAGDDVATVTAEYLPADLAEAVFAGELVLKVAFATLATDPRLHGLTRDGAFGLDREVWAGAVREWETARAAGARP